MAKPNHNGNGANKMMKSVRDLLTDKQIERVVAIMNSEDDPERRVSKVRKYLEQFHANLVVKGVVPAYLAYYFEFLLETGQLNK